MISPYDEFEFFLPRLLITRHFNEQMRMYNQVSAKFCSKPKKELIGLWKTAFKFSPLLSKKVVLKVIWGWLNISGGQA